MKRIIRIIIIVGIVCILLCCAARFRVVTVSKGHIFDVDKIDEFVDCQDVIVLGAGVRDDGSMSPILEERAITVKDLYDHGKACSIIISGHEEEVFAMQHGSDDVHFYAKDLLTKRTINDATQMLRDSKAASFNEIPYSESSETDKISRVAHRR